MAKEFTILVIAIHTVEILYLSGVYSYMNLHLKLLNDGYYQHNVNVLAKKRGEIIPYRRSSHCSDYYQFIPCKWCRAMFAKHCLWKHRMKCPFRPGSGTDNTGRQRHGAIESDETCNQRNTARVLDGCSKTKLKNTRQQREVEKAGQDVNPASDNGATDEDCNNSVRVAVTNNDGRRRFDKKKFCKYCMKAVLKLPTCHII